MWVRSVVLNFVCVRLSQLFLAHHRHFVKQARALRVPVFTVSICMRAQYVALLRFSLFGACLCSSLSIDGLYADASWHQ